MSATTATRATIAERALGAHTGLAAKIGLAVAGSLLLAISAKLSVQLGPVPFSFQTLMLLLIAGCYGRNLAVATVVLYLTEGLAGLPVFAPTTVPGAAAFIGPTGGFLAGFVVCAAIVGEAADRGLDRSPLTLAPAMLVGIAVLFAMGFAWLAFGATLSSGNVGAGVANAWAWGVGPFVVGDLIKIAIAALAIPAGQALLKR